MSLQRAFRTAVPIVLGAGALLQIALTAAAADTYRIDSVHSSVIFRVKHFNVAYFYGRFNDLSGRVVIDTQNPTRSSFEVEIQAESIDTKNSRRDGHLKSPDFFSARQFRTINFKSTQVKQMNGNVYEVAGDLSLHGVTKPVTLKVEHTGSGRGQRGSSISGFETTFTIKRSDFGVDYMLRVLSDEVRLTVSLECIRS